MLRHASLLLLGMLAPVVNAQEAEHEPTRFVRIQLHGPERIVSLAEVEVYVAGQNVARSGTAKQSSVASGGVPERAIDGNANGVYTNASVTHTNAERDAWWEVDLGEAQQIERVVVHNRTDCCQERLQGFTLQLLDKKHKLLWERPANQAPYHTLEIVPWTEAPSVPTGPTREMRAEFQPAIDKAIDDGAQFLLRRQLWDGSFQHLTHQYRVGSTGLAVYTLLKCKVPRDHPAVRQAVRYLLAHPPKHTYELATVLMALDALDDPAHHKYMQSLLDELLSYQGTRSEDGKKDPLWAYPELHSTVADLSNTQYAALGLRAAKHSGLKIPPRAWTGLMTAVMRYQEEPRSIADSTARKGSTSTGKREIAGFPYRVRGKATSSMTTAGLGVLGICMEGIANPPAGLRRKFENSSRLATGWLTHNFTVDNNIGGGQHWQLYYLYGLERVGALLGIDHFGTHDWYWEGAKVIVPKQDGNGGWSTDNEADTCFALLFLARATANPNSGAKAAEALPQGTWVAEDEASALRWRITGGDQAVFFITGFSDGTLRDFASGEEGKQRGLRVARVEYLINGEVVETLATDPDRAWTSERYAVRHAFERRGTYICEVRAFVQVSEDGVSGELVEITGEPLSVKVESTDDPVLREYVQHGLDNLIKAGRASAKATSENLAEQSAALAVDGLLGTYWIAKRNDKLPTLTVTLDRAQRGQTLLISHAGSNEFSRKAHDRATRLRVVLNDDLKQTHIIEAPDGEEVKIRLELEKPIKLRKIEITILDRVRGTKYPGAIGFSEVQWLKAAKKR